MSDKESEHENTHEIQDVPTRAISHFLDLLAKEEGYTEIAMRLREEILVRGKSSETSIRKAIFGDDLS